MTTSFALIRRSTLVFADLFTAATVASLVLFRFEAVAVPLLPGLLLVLWMRRSACRISPHAATARGDLRELARANVGIFSFTLLIAGGEVWLGWSRSPLHLATCALSAFGLLQGAMMFTALRLLPPSEASFSEHDAVPHG